MPARLTATQRRLLDWAELAGRDLPWRDTRDPWSILVSEVMLQQTQVARVVPVWRAFLQRFPTATACADAPLADVVTAWSGMGYNRRAVNLHRCAIAIRDEHGGAMPRDLHALLGLPGVGRYTARAVMVFAFEQPVGVVDVNAARVHARLAGRALNLDEVQHRADAATPVDQPWRWNQAVLDLGATICTKRNPDCGACPITRECGWRRAGYLEPDPVEGSAAVPRRQSRFEGSDRQGRGRLVDALRRAPVDKCELANAMGWANDPDRAMRVAMTVVADGVAKWEPEEERFFLPG